MNYGRRTECNTGCGFKKSDLPSFGGFFSGQHSNAQAGDWECPKCNNLNFARRDRCNRSGCDFERKDLGGFGSGSGKFGDNIEPGQWECPR